MNHEQEVRSAILVLLTTTAEPDGDPTTVSNILRDRLVGNGFSVASCEELATFVPLAFSREVLRHWDVIDYPSHYVAATITSSNETQHPLSNNALYDAARSIASQWKVDDEKRRIASFSGEYRALTNLFKDAEARGAQLKAASVSPPYVVYSGHPTQTEMLNKRPWWKLW